MTAAAKAKRIEDGRMLSGTGYLYRPGMCVVVVMSLGVPRKRL